ncbi:hypothetical protein HDU76_009110 [Blyttiomyces sp. JEL0837]|nr:hypothetical protein HDU76_009110 [Blyttiomyces sp. JEL0837]
MREGRLSPESRSIVVRSCDLLLSERVIPSRLFKSYLPTANDSPLFGASLPTTYHTILDDIDCDRESLRPRSSDATMVGSSTGTGTDGGSSGTDGGYGRSRSTTTTTTTTTTATATNGGAGRKPETAGSKAEEKMKGAVWSEPYRHIEFVRNEKNCEFTGRQLSRLVKDYKLEQVVHGIKWLIEGWSIESTARVLKHIFHDWLPELAAFAISKIGATWSLRPKMGLVVAYLMMGESVQVVALFIRSLVIGWAGNSITELISCLDTVLEWSEEYFNQFTDVFMKELVDAKQRQEMKHVDPSAMMQALASLYKTSAAMANYRIVLADLRLAIAKSNYIAQFSHFLSCQDCLRYRPCPYTTSQNQPVPTPSALIAVTRNITSLSQIASTHRIPPYLRPILGIVLQQHGSIGSSSDMLQLGIGSTSFSTLTSGDSETLLTSNGDNGSSAYTSFCDAGTTTPTASGSGSSSAAMSTQTSNADLDNMMNTNTSSTTGTSFASLSQSFVSMGDEIDRGVPGTETATEIPSQSTTRYSSRRQSAHPQSQSQSHPQNQNQRLEYIIPQQNDGMGMITNESNAIAIPMQVIARAAALAGTSVPELTAMATAAAATAAASIPATPSIPTTTIPLASIQQQHQHQNPITHPGSAATGISTNHHNGAGGMGMGMMTPTTWSRMQSRDLETMASELSLSLPPDFPDLPPEEINIDNEGDGDAIDVEMGNTNVGLQRTTNRDDSFIELDSTELDNNNTSGGMSQHLDFSPATVPEEMSWEYTNPQSQAAATTIPTSNEDAREIFGGLVESMSTQLPARQFTSSMSSLSRTLRGSRGSVGNVSVTVTPRVVSGVSLNVGVAGVVGVGVTGSASSSGGSSSGSTGHGSRGMRRSGSFVKERSSSCLSFDAEELEESGKSQSKKV